MIFYFHTCNTCGRIINPERLEVLPETKLCKECAEKLGTDIIVSRTEIGMDIDTYRDLLGAIRS
ncbi:MAG TPA: TraR/DksA C4-type zinc finger protein [Halanaerobiales bacterium]|nr:TraR/DksA C4-type zinc finger protein [Halanaerobiales bacterium]